MRHKISRLIASGILGGGAAGVAELNLTAPAITPTQGDELVTNGGFASDTSNWSAGGSATLASVSGGQSGNCLEVTNGSFGYAVQQLPALTVGAYYFLTLYQKNGTGGGIPRWGINANANEYAGQGTTQADWTLKRYVARVTSATSNITLIMNSASAGQTTLFDTVSCKLLTDTGVLLGDLGRKNGTYTCTPTVAQFSHCGMDVNWLDANNLVRAVVTHNAGVSATASAKLLKRISGTWTEVITGTITYSAAAPLAVVVSGTSFSLYYNSVQVGTTQTIDNSGLGTKVYGFNTLAGNTVGTVTTNP